MVKALTDENLFIRWAAARVLERIAPLGSEEGVPALAKALKDEDAALLSQADSQPRKD